LLADGLIAADPGVVSTRRGWSPAQPLRRRRRLFGQAGVHAEVLSGARAVARQLAGAEAPSNPPWWRRFHDHGCFRGRSSPAVRPWSLDFHDHGSSGGVPRA